MTFPALMQLQEIFGNIDIYLFDQLLKGRIQPGMKLLDAGCGDGRNIRYLLQAGVEVYGADASAEAIARVREMASSVAPRAAAHFSVCDVAMLPYPADSFDVVICSAVLHFSRDEEHFKEMVLEIWRVLKPGGTFFCRLSTTIGLEGILQHLHARFYQMAHGTVWFLADEKLLREMTVLLHGELLEPIKTVLVEQERGMTTWVLRKKV